MSIRRPALLFSLLMLPACSFDVDADRGASVGGHYEVVPAPIDSIETDLLLVNTRTGAVYRRDGDRWTKFVEKVQ